MKVLREQSSIHCDSYTDGGWSNATRRSSEHKGLHMPGPAKPSGRQLKYDTEWAKDGIEEKKVVDRIRQRVGLWRQGG